MRLLLDTHILLWTVAESRKLSAAARALIGEPDNELTFSAVNLWEVAIKTGRGRDDFRIDVSSLRRALFDNGYAVLAMSGAHARRRGWRACRPSTRTRSIACWSRRR